VTRLGIAYQLLPITVMGEQLSPTGTSILVRSRLKSEATKETESLDDEATLLQH
jgi:hypothetical protein